MNPNLVTVLAQAADPSFLIKFVTRNLHCARQTDRQLN